MFQAQSATSDASAAKKAAPEPEVCWPDYPRDDAAFDELMDKDGDDAAALREIG